MTTANTSPREAWIWKQDGSADGAAERQLLRDAMAFADQNPVGGLSGQERVAIYSCCDNPRDCKWGGVGGCGYEGRKEELARSLTHPTPAPSVREALERIAEPNQDAMRAAAATGDVMRILQATLTMLNQCRDEARAAVDAYEEAK